MHLTDLNDDVLLPIIQLLDLTSLQCLTLTCRTGRTLAMPYLLRDVTLHKGWSQVSSFCEFILADAEYRAPLVRILRLSSRQTVLYNKGTKKRYLSPKAIKVFPLLRQFLQAASRLHTISASSSMGIAMAAAGHGIDTAILHAPQLSRVVVDSKDDIRHVCHGAQYCSWERWTGRQEWFRIISRMHGLRTIELSAVPGASLHTVLAPHRDTLERLILRGELNTAALQRNMQWSSVRELILHNLTAREALVQAFPNVRYLELGVEPDGRIFYCHQTTDVNTKSTICWPYLDHVRGSSVGLMSMVLKCRIRRLDVDLTQMPQVLCIAPQYDFQDVLKTVSPAVLSLRMPSWFTPGYCRNVAAAVPDLKCLTLNIFHDDRVPSNARDILMMFLANTLAGLKSLVYLSVQIQYPSPVASLISDPICAKEQIVAQLAASLPSLQYLELSWEDIGWGHTWWRRTEVEPSSSVRNFIIYPISTSFGLAARQRCMKLA